MIKFEFENNHYSTSDEAYNAHAFRLPDGRYIRVTRWAETSPPKVMGIELTSSVVDARAEQPPDEAAFCPILRNVAELGGDIRRDSNTLAVAIAVGLERPPTKADLVLFAAHLRAVADRVESAHD